MIFMYTLYSMQNSGNCYKLRLMMAQLGINYQIKNIDVLGGETRTQAFLKINPNGKVPLLVFPDGRAITESGAALFYLSEGSPYLPAERYERAQVLQWMFFEQYSHEPYIAVARFWLSLAINGRAQMADQLPEWLERGHQALGVMEKHLEFRNFFVAETYSIADIALYAYTHMAHEGDFDLSSYPAINDWLELVKAQPGHVPIDWMPE